MQKTKFSISRGFALPFGVSKHSDGMNFSLFSHRATKVGLCLFEPGVEAPFQEIVLDPQFHKTGAVWHVLVHELPAHFHYAYRVDGKSEKGQKFDWHTLLLDPYARRIVRCQEWGKRLTRSEDRKAVVYPDTPFDWQGDTPPSIPMRNLIIYEMHVRSFTQDPSSKVAHPGTFAGILEKIPYLKSLGVNAIELMPITAFNELERSWKGLKGEQLYQYWGYSALNFFALHEPYARLGYDPITDFKELVRALHREGIEVILDIVDNHTGEGNDMGPAVSFKGIDNPTYYILSPDGHQTNYTGCGNTFNSNDPNGLAYIHNSLRYFVAECHVDGFRFDLASIHTRDPEGAPMGRPPLIEALAKDPLLAKIKLIAEPWDASGLYQVGSFPNFGRFSEWNGKYRDAVRRFIKGTDGSTGEFATRLSGSEDLYGHRTPASSINFITAHDGFTLQDLVSYNEKHNEGNGENNQDGINDNISWNCGVEGQTDQQEVLQLRLRQRKNFFLALLVSQGVPMLWMGDEYGHTKGGNNNTWTQDDRLNWFQWDTAEKERDFLQFVSKLIAFRKAHSVFSHPTFLRHRDVRWHGSEPGKPNWWSRYLGFTLRDTHEGYKLYIGFNSSDHPFTLHLPQIRQKEPWRRIIHTGLPSPQDFVEAGEVVTDPTQTLPPFSAALFRTVITNKGEDEGPLPH